MIYFDNSATTKMSEVALNRYIEIARDGFGNPSSRHAVGTRAKMTLEDARKTILSAIGAPGDLIFGASGSESDNLAVFGRAYAKARFRGGKILSTAGEHSAIYQSVRKLESEGYRVAFIPTTGGKLDMDFVRKEMTPDVFLVSVMTVNNETGAVYDLAAVSSVMRAQAPDALLHTDATQSFLRVPFSVKVSGVDMMTISSHKLRGPQGVSALYVREGILKKGGLAPLIYGGGQEQNLRSGTENLPGVAAFAAAVADGFARKDDVIARENACRNALLYELSTRAELSEVRPVCPPVAAPHILSLTLPDIKSEVALNYLSRRGICVSSGSACSSHDKHISGALLAYGLSEKEADCTIRVSFGEENTVEEVKEFADALADAVRTLARVR